MANYNWPINPSVVTTGPIQIVVNGIPRQITIDTAIPADSYPLPTQEYARFRQAAMIDCSDTPIVGGTPTLFISMTNYATQLEIINSTGAVFQIIINGTDEFFVGSQGLGRQAVALVNGDIIEVNAIQGNDVDSGVLAINTFY